MISNVSFPPDLHSVGCNAACAQRQHSVVCADIFVRTQMSNNFIIKIYNIICDVFIIMLHRW